MDIRDQIRRNIRDFNYVHTAMHYAISDHIL